MYVTEKKRYLMGKYHEIILDFKSFLKFYFTYSFYFTQEDHVLKLCSVQVCKRLIKACLNDGRNYIYVFMFIINNFISSLR